jgi:hypothetical protein
VPGNDYEFRVKAENAFGQSVEWSPTATIMANQKPDKVDTPTTEVFNGVNVKVSWTRPSDNWSPLISYEILLQAFDGTFHSHPSCLGADPDITECEVSINSLRAEPFLLVQKSVVVAKIRALNGIDWGEFSDPNSIGATIFVEPYKMITPTRGFATSESLIEIEWLPIPADSDETGGSAIDSYNLQWKVKDSADDYVDLVGEDGNFQTGVVHIQETGVVASTTYLFRVRAHNVLGWGEFSEPVQIVSAKVPEKPDPPVLTISNIFVRIEWAEPYTNSAPIEAYEIEVADSMGTFAVENLYCKGAEEPVLSNRYCNIPMDVLRSEGFNLSFDTLV